MLPLDFIFLSFVENVIIILWCIVVHFCMYIFICVVEEKVQVCVYTYRVQRAMLDIFLGPQNLYRPGHLPNPSCYLFLGKTHHIWITLYLCIVIFILLDPLISYSQFLYFFLCLNNH